MTFMLAIHTATNGTGRVPANPLGALQTVNQGDQENNLEGCVTDDQVYNVVVVRGSV